MYRQNAFAMTDDEALALVAASGPAHLVTCNGGRLQSSIVPMLLGRDASGDGRDALVGHLARANRQWRDVDADVEALAIFSGADAYVSPSAYPTKNETGRVVPTWNYSVVHVYGLLVVHDDARWTTELVRRLTDHHERARQQPWSVDDTPAGFIETTVKGIVGIELEITRVEGARKLSQNRGAADFGGVIAVLSAGADREREVAADMERLPPRRVG